MTPPYGSVRWYALVRWRKRKLAKRFPDGKVSEHFRYIEFATKDGTPIPLKAVPGLQKLCRVYLEPMRERFGPVQVMSGYRHRRYNEKIGGAGKSHHIWDEQPYEPAADLIFARGRPDQWGAYARKLRLKNRGEGGVGVYPGMGFVHVDVRKYRADWRGR